MNLTKIFQLLVLVYYFSTQLGKIERILRWLVLLICYSFLRPLMFSDMHSRCFRTKEWSWRKFFFFFLNCWTLNEFIENVNKMLKWSKKNVCSLLPFYGSLEHILAKYRVWPKLAPIWLLNRAFDAESPKESEKGIKTTQKRHQTKHTHTKQNKKTKNKTIL